MLPEEQFATQSAIQLSELEIQQNTVMDAPTHTSYNLLIQHLGPLLTEKLSGQHQQHSRTCRDSHTDTSASSHTDFP